jgi:hypothetical protein
MYMLCNKLRMVALPIAVFAVTLFVNATGAQEWRTCIAEGRQAITALLADDYIKQGQPCPPNVPGNLCYRLTWRFRQFTSTGPQINGEACARGTYPAVKCPGYRIGNDVICIIGVQEYGPPDYNVDFITDGMPTTVTFMRYVVSPSLWQGRWKIVSRHTSGVFAPGGTAVTVFDVTLYNGCKMFVHGIGDVPCRIENNTLRATIRGNGNVAQLSLTQANGKLRGTFKGSRISDGAPIGGTYTGKRLN